MHAYRWCVDTGAGATEEWQAKGELGSPAADRSVTAQVNADEWLLARLRDPALYVRLSLLRAVERLIRRHGTAQADGR
jgi:hypothetical protein